MNDFQEKLFKTNYHKKISIDKDNFLKSLHLKIKKTEEKRKLNNAYFGIIVLFLFLIINQHRLIDNPIEYLYYEDALYELDFHSINSDSLQLEDQYTYDVYMFLLEEGDIWQALDLINELENEVKT
ncbi:MAG: hypothetical protein ACJZ1Q_01025 [Candidatus Neomarinimicrobiota bacterium]|nr:hypothetical protein [Candidatus Neomarinimicrobiota bacterium]|tara:strand:- start:186 stop:563 length:378 start_codon:yes stop_codon:yes gene_type:complete